jgi:hypothetical protein
MALHKVTVKLYDDVDRTQDWIHFCYIDTAMYNKFNKRLCSFRKTRTDWIREWLKNDFNLPFKSRDELNLAKDAIRDSFKSEYPELFLASLSDRQGWVRVWMTKKVGDALNAKRPAIHNRS